MMRRSALAAVALLLALAPAASGETRAVAIKLASFVPEGSIWDKGLRQMGEEWKRASAGRVSLTLFAGGQQGEERTVLSKIRLGTLQGASLTILGLGQIDTAFNVFAIPFFYEGYDELHHVLDALTPTFRQRLEAHGFVMLGWGDAGWVHVFARRPIATLEEMKRLPIYTSAGDERMVQWYKQEGFEPRPLAFSDVPSALATGLVEAVPITPVAALFLQWYRPAPHMVDVGLGPLVGATVVARRTWDAIGAEDRAAMLESARRFDERLRADVPEQDREAIVQMTQRGLAVSSPGDREAWRALGERFAASMRGTYVPEDLFDRALAERDAFRRRTSAPR